MNTKALCFALRRYKERKITPNVTYIQASCITTLKYPGKQQGTKNVSITLAMEKCIPDFWQHPSRSPSWVHVCKAKTGIERGFTMTQASIEKAM
jgi:hypothetical protein